jgi:hypothetical protein
MDETLAKAIKEDLFNELRWLLCAATEWAAYDTLIEKPPIPKIAEPCFHLKVYTINSALLHARSLYEFFTATEHSMTRNPTRLTWRNYGLPARQASDKYNQFMEPLHGRVMHLDKNRAGYDEIKSEVVNLAKDILRLWNAFSTHQDIDPDYAELLDKSRKQAIEEARSVAKQYAQHDEFTFPFDAY